MLMESLPLRLCGVKSPPLVLALPSSPMVEVANIYHDLKLLLSFLLCRDCVCAMFLN